MCILITLIFLTKRVTTHRKLSRFLAQRKCMYIYQNFAFMGFFNKERHNSRYCLLKKNRIIPEIYSRCCTHVKFKKGIQSHSYGHREHVSSFLFFEANFPPLRSHIYDHFFVDAMELQEHSIVNILT